MQVLFLCPLLSLASIIRKGVKEDLLGCSVDAILVLLRIQIRQVFILGSTSGALEAALLIEHRCWLGVLLWRRFLLGLGSSKHTDGLPLFDHHDLLNNTVLH